MLKKKISKIFIGSNNRGKLREIKELLPKRVKIYTPIHLNLSKSPKENGKTFMQNSLIKAKYYSNKSAMICLADDSGLEIDILNKRPGIFSARWSGREKDFNIAIKKVFKKLDEKDQNWRIKKIKARFICALTIYGPGFKTIKSIGKVEGKISKEKKGKNGFGYDPIFIPLNRKKTFGEMKPSEKYKMDHRSKAFKKIKKFL